MNITNSLQKTSQQNLATELTMLWATSQFFTSLQNIMLEKELTPDVNLAELYNKMEALQAADMSAESSMLIEVQRALQRTRANLAIIDSKISVSVMRLFFERTGEEEFSSLKHIVHYYLHKPAKDESDRDKLDFLITRYCSTVTTGANNMKLRKVKEDLDAILENLNQGKVETELESIQTATLTRLRQITRLILDARSFNTLIEGKLISNLRDYKIHLGDTFYVPVILAEIIRGNIAVHNKFQELYYSEQARLRIETARMVSTLQTTNKLSPIKELQNPRLNQFNSLVIQMQQVLQELKRELAEQIVQDRAARASIEAQGASISSLIASVEDSLKRSRDLSLKVQEVYNLALKEEPKTSS